MKTLIRISLVLAALVLACEIAQAAVLVTPPVNPTGLQRVQCGIVNATKRPRDVKVDWMADDGSVVISTQTITLPPHGSFGSYASTGLERYCRFTVEGGKSQYRAHLVLLDLGARVVRTTVPAE